jgi:hypothetical protein
MNRAASYLADFTDYIQAALNRNGHKKPLEEMTRNEIVANITEEKDEAITALSRYHAALSRESSLEFKNKLRQDAERECADLAVTALAGWIWARRHR